MKENPYGQIEKTQEFLNEQIFNILFCLASSELETPQLLEEIGFPNIHPVLVRDVEVFPNKPIHCAQT